MTQACNVLYCKNKAVWLVKWRGMDGFLREFPCCKECLQSIIKTLAEKGIKAEATLIIKEEKVIFS